jgi:hypothetical protein
MMGYTTEFNGRFELDKPLAGKDKEFLDKLSKTRRMKREFEGHAYGFEGEMYVDGGGDFGQHHEGSITDYNSPPASQPSLWCGWTPNEDGTAIEWDGGEKFYGYVEWIEWIIDKVLEPRGYKLTGDVDWRGEEWSDSGTILVNDNDVVVARMEVRDES